MFVLERQRRPSVGVTELGSCDAQTYVSVAGLMSTSVAHFPLRLELSSRPFNLLYKQPLFREHRSILGGEYLVWQSVKRISRDRVFLLGGGSTRPVDSRRAVSTAPERN